MSPVSLLLMHFLANVMAWRMPARYSRNAVVDFSMSDRWRHVRCYETALRAKSPPRHHLAAKQNKDIAFGILLQD